MNPPRAGAIVPAQNHENRDMKRKRLQFRSIWISDVHLGTRACKAEYLLDFLRHTESRYLYLVGDMIDFWNLRNGWYWPASHSQVIQAVMDKASRGTTVTYVPGNHDEMFRDHIGRQFGGVRVAAEAIHKTADGRKLLVLHGDEFDGVVRHSKWLAVFGSWIYDWLLYTNRWFNYLRRRLGFPYWSLVRLSQAQGQERGEFHHVTSSKRWCARRASAACTAWSAGTSTRRRSKSTRACCIATTAIGSRAAPRSSSTRTGSLALIHWADESVYLLSEKPT
jgi:UDP-2,3-diacylglucosamine pyrophosphatase LpxH